MLSTADKENTNLKEYQSDNIKITEPIQDSIKDFCKEQIMEVIEKPSLSLTFFINSSVVEDVTITPNSLKKKGGNIVVKPMTHKFLFWKR